MFNVTIFKGEKNHKLFEAELDIFGTFINWTISAAMGLN